MATRPPRIATPSAGWRKSPRKCWPTSTRKRSISSPNYDGKELEPTVLPARIPNLLINGSSGIAVGMATNIPPHNLTEIVTACLALLDNPDLTVDELIEHVPAPDFPTAGIIYGTEGVREGYRTGRGRVVIRARTHIEDLDKGGRQAIIVDELPYQVNKATLLTRIGELVREKKLDGISDLRDESDKSGMRVVIELKRGEVAEIILNNLFKLTQLQDSFGMNMVALVDGQPRVAQPQAVPRSTSCSTGEKSSCGARASSCERRASAATSSRASRSRCPTSTRSSR